MVNITEHKAAYRWGVCKADGRSRNGYTLTEGMTYWSDTSRYVARWDGADICPNLYEVSWRRHLSDTFARSDLASSHRKRDEIAVFSKPHLERLRRNRTVNRYNLGVECDCAKASGKSHNRINILRTLRHTHAGGSCNPNALDAGAELRNQVKEQAQNQVGKVLRTLSTTDFTSTTVECSIRDPWHCPSEARKHPRRLDRALHVAHS